MSFIILFISHQNLAIHYLSFTFFCGYFYFTDKNTNEKIKTLENEQTCNTEVLKKQNKKQSTIINGLESEITKLTSISLKSKNAHETLEKKWVSLSEKSASSNKYLWDIIQSNADILQNFLKDIPGKIKSINQEFSLLQEQSANRSILTNLDIQIQQIKNHSCLLKLADIENKCKKIETLSKIVKSKTGEIRLERLVEMENHFMLLIDALKMYEKLGIKYLEQLQKNQKNKLSTSGQRLLNIENHFQVLQRMIFSGNISSVELNIFLKTTHKALSQVFEIPPLKEKIIFEFCDFFDQILKMYFQKLNTRQIRWKVSHETPRILLFCDCVKINKQLALFLYMSVLLTEKKSKLFISSCIISATKEKDWDILEIKTEIQNVNKSEKTREAIKKLFREYQKISRNSLAELDITNTGLCFRFPGIINKKFKHTLVIAIFGPMCDRLSKKLTNCTKFFPFDFEIVLNPTNCYNIDIAVADSNVLETLGNHIHKQLAGGEHSIPLIIPIKKDEEDPITFIGEYYYLHLPVRSVELRWLLFQCLDYIVSQEKIPKIGKTIMFQRPPRR